MTRATPHRPRHETGDFAKAKAEATRAEGAERVKAARTVADNSIDAGDQSALLAMLGLPERAEQGPDEAAVLGRALGRYVRAVAEAVGVPVEGTSFEVTDTATAYLALSRRRPERPDQDLMLVWNERQGWAVSVEVASPVVLARLDGDVVAAPRTVAEFVSTSIARGGPHRTLVAVPPPANRLHLAERMDHHVGSASADYSPVVPFGQPSQETR
ncbi:DUF6292 family protein [Actinokineospora sp. NBRC 105648]|uniref:DUF6292 family protein n=1 Tax=Actinokineospora sp. NBRC 105648 TaxID=3032206 RepID=UPI0024A3E341|nr:DUF6292 family protein [Actinokineospora sp. NBRC 105648]GLZ41950.1 hypothetical protein Acsp05_55740 [Actinokineospora sp. NBRC 105648]